MATPSPAAASPPANKKVALITGITGQDGSYLAEFLLEKNYAVHGIMRRASSFNTGRIEHLMDSIQLHYGDLTDSGNLCSILQRVRPDEIYNLAAQSHVKVSFEEPEYTGSCDGLGCLRLLEAMRTCGLEKTCKFYQASTSELYGKVQEIPQTELTPFYPRSPYAVAKLYAFWMCVNYREAYNVFAVNGILFNHESPRRGGTFVTKKVTTGVAQIVAGQRQKICLGNLDAKRDWGHARDYVRGMWLMLQSDDPADFVLATGVQYSVRELCEICFKMAGRPIEWRGSGLGEEGVEIATGKTVVSVDERYYRPTEVETLLGSPVKAREQLGWIPEIGFEELIYDMLNHDFLLHGLKLPSSALALIPGGPISKEFRYPDLELLGGCPGSSLPVPVAVPSARSSVSSTASTFSGDGTSPADGRYGRTEEASAEVENQNEEGGTARMVMSLHGVPEVSINSPTAAAVVRI